MSPDGLSEACRTSVGFLYLDFRLPAETGTRHFRLAGTDVREKPISKAYSL